MLPISYRYLPAALLLSTASAVHASGGTDSNFNVTLGDFAGSSLETDGGGDDAFGNTFIGRRAGKDTTIGDDNVFVGERAGDGNVTGSENVFIGRFAGIANDTGSENVFIGHSAGDSNDGQFNTFVGHDAGVSNTSGDRNTFIGQDAGRSNETGVRNTFLGENAGLNNVIGLNNTYVGEGAGFNATGDNNVFIGFRAGENESGSDRLYIESSDASDPLIYGEFDNDLLAVNGTLGVGTQLPMAPLHVRRSDGTANLLVEEANATAAPRQLYTLENNGPIAFGMVNNDLTQEWRFAAQTTGFRISLGGSGGQEFEVGNDGTLAVGPAGTQNLFLDTSGNLTIQGTLTELSSRAEKQGIEPVNGDRVLEKLARLEVSRWSYEDQQARHLGPMAEDFHAAFGLGEDARHIAPKDMAGVAMASAQALQKKMEHKEARIQQLEEENADLRQRVEELADMVGRLATAMKAGGDRMAAAEK